VSWCCELLLIAFGYREPDDIYLFIAQEISIVTVQYWTSKLSPAVRWLCFLLGNKAGLNVKKTAKHDEQ
jgi:hypothetical protein